MKLKLVIALVSCCAAFASMAIAGQAASESRGCRADEGSFVVTSTHYRFVLRIGPGKRVYTPAQVKRLRPSSGDVLLAGSEETGGIAMGPANHVRHIGFQICSRTTGSVLTRATPIVVLTDSMGMATYVPVAVMRSVVTGADDAHFGNNLTAPTRGPIAVKVAMGHETVTFREISGSHT